MLKKYLKIHKLNVAELSRKIGITEQSLRVILNNKPKEIKFMTAMKIKKATGLMPWDYCEGLEELEKIYLKENK